MKLICLTGKRGTGKSVILKEINELNLKKIITFKADDFIKYTYLKNNSGYKAINDKFGNAYNNPYGIDRCKLAKAVYNDYEIYQKLVKITNPLIFEWIKGLKKKYPSYIVIVELAIYLKFEKEFQKLFNYVILIKNKTEKKENHVSDFLDENKIEADLNLNNFDHNNAIKIIKWLKSNV